MPTLVYAPGACSLSPHIVARELGMNIKLEKLDFATGKTETGNEIGKISPKGQVPILALDNGEKLTEGPVIVQYLADQKPEAGLLPKNGMERYRVQEWLNYITSELHKSFSPLFNPKFPEDAKKVVLENLKKKFTFLNERLAGKQYLMGDQFTVADAYCFTVINWVNFLNIDISAYPNLVAYQQRVAQRPRVMDALKAEGLLQ
ncbi:MAG TPA: glutathione transferase GstA [Dongiaceae bacterium]|jgi:glutathione S-transferase|nr:glutathione transferase GstA [Dongiaceae bacterium]